MSRQVGAKRQKYSPDVLVHAAELVRSNSISLNQASKEYGIPKTTLQNTVHYKYSKHKVGHKTVLTEAEEQRIAEWCVHMARIGYGRTRQELLHTVKTIIDEDERPNPFHDNKPGRAWLDGFFKRNPQLTVRTTIQLGKERAIINADKIKMWFDNFKTYIENEVRDSDLLSDPTRIYNADETGVSLCLKGNQVIGMKGAPVVYHFGNSDKAQITVMAACSAAAHYIPPMLVFPGQRFSYNPLEGFEEAVLGRSDNGWMDSTLFCSWLETAFIPAINERKVKKPVLLLIDGHKTHVTMEASDICLSNGIELYCLLEHASHIMQPLDLRFFAALKRNWKQAVRDWQLENIGSYVTKATFAGVFKHAWTASTSIDAAVKGFKEAGLFPLDENIVTSSVKIDPSKTFAPKEINEKDDKASDARGESVDENEAVLSDITNEQVTRKPEPSINAPPSPFSKHLSLPLIDKCTTPRVQKTTIPKAITGSAYRKLLQERKIQKEEQEKEKEQRKQERIAKRKMKEDEKFKKRAEKEAKRREQAEKRRRKRELREKLLQSLENSDEESDGGVQVDTSACFTCEKPYDTDFMECSNCFRRFHIECACDDYMAVEGLPFECKYC
jgi:hypothetical protein